MNTSLICKYIEKIGHELVSERKYLLSGDAWLLGHNDKLADVMIGICLFGSDGIIYTWGVFGVNQFSFDTANYRHFRLIVPLPPSRMLQPEGFINTIEVTFTPYNFVSRILEDGRPLITVRHSVRKKTAPGKEIDLELLSPFAETHKPHYMDLVVSEMNDHFVIVQL